MGARSASRGACGPCALSTGRGRGVRETRWVYAAVARASSAPGSEPWPPADRGGAAPGHAARGCVIWDGSEPHHGGTSETGIGTYGPQGTFPLAAQGTRHVHTPPRQRLGHAVMRRARLGTPDRPVHAPQPLHRSQDTLGREIGARKIAVAREVHSPYNKNRPETAPSTQGSATEPNRPAGSTQPGGGGSGAPGATPTTQIPKRQRPTSSDYPAPPPNLFVEPRLHADLRPRIDFFFLCCFERFCPSPPPHFLGVFLLPLLPLSSMFGFPTLSNSFMDRFTQPRCLLS